MGNSEHGNLFSNLSKWAIRQNENFTTEILVFLLNHLRINEPSIAVKILDLMTNGFLSDINDPQQIQINTQIVIDEGRPDIEIKYTPMFR